MTRTTATQPPREAHTPVPFSPPSSLRYASPSGDRGASWWISLALIVTATNAVLIQTIVPDESSQKNLIRVGVLLLGALVLMLRRAVLPPWLVALILLSAVLLAATSNTDQLTVLFVLVIVPALWSIPERRLERSAMIASVFALALVFVFLALGWTTNELRVSQTYLSADIRARYTFGTEGVPFFMNLVYGAAVLIIFYAYRWQLRGKLLLALVAVGVTTYLFLQTDGRGGFGAVLLFCALAMLLPKLSRWSLVPTLLMMQPVIYTAFTFWLASRQADPSANQLFSFRPKLYAQFLDSVTIVDLFTSTPVKANALGTTVDSSMLHLLYGGGVVFFAAFCFLFARAARALLRRGMHLHLAFLTATMAYGVSESILLRVENVFILFAWYVILRYALPDPEGDSLGKTK